MKKTGSPAIKALLAMGVFALVLLLASAAGLRHFAYSARRSPFNGQRAFEQLQTVVAFGPRPSGSEALARLQNYIQDTLEKAGLEVRRHEFRASTPVGELPMVNITGIVQGTEPGIIILGNHYETKLFDEFTFVGANDGGSTTAWMLEMARALGPKRQGKTVWLCFFDGEEAFREWSSTDGIYGSREFVKKLKDENLLLQITAMINVDLIGDCLLNIKRDRDAPEWLTRIVWDKARELGHGDRFLPFVQLVEDDHVPFRRAGVPALNLIDYAYGGSPSDHRRNWHTPNDTIDKVCADSLQAVGDVIYHALPEIDAYTAGSATKLRD